MSKKALDENSVPERPTPIGQSYELFRPKVITDNITAFLETHKEPGYIYKGVTMNDPHNPRNVLVHEANGYEIVYTTHQFSDDRAFAPDSQKKDSSVPGPVIKVTKDNKQYLLMRISDEKFNQMKEKEAKDAKDKYLRSVKTVNSKGNQLNIHGGFINSNSTGDSE